MQVVEYALGQLPTVAKAVLTPTGTGYDGMRVNASVCGVSIVRSGESMEAALRSCWKGVDIGKILVTRRHKASPGSTPGCTRNGSVSADAVPPTPPMATDVNGSYYRRHAEADSRYAAGHLSRNAFTPGGAQHLLLFFCPLNLWMVAKCMSRSKHALGLVSFLVATLVCCRPHACRTRRCQ